MSDLSSVDVFDLLERADVKHLHAASGGAEANFSCPFSGHNHGDENPSAYMNVETTAWFCWGCKRRGNAISFWAEHMVVSTAEAQRFLRETYGIEFSEPIGGSMVSEVDLRFAPLLEFPPAPRPSGSFLSSLRVDWMLEAHTNEPQLAYLLSRGFTVETLIEWSIGYDYYTDRVTIPVFDVAGELFGVKGRAWRDGHQPRYLVMGDRNTMHFGFPPYETTEVVFGLHRARDHGEVVILEGELNAVASSQAGVPRPTAIGMSYFSDRQAELIVREATSVVVWFDPDKAGVEAVEGRVGSDGKRMLGVVEKLEPYLPVRVVDAPQEDAAELVRQVRGSEVVELVASARSSLAVEKLLR